MIVLLIVFFGVFGVKFIWVMFSIIFFFIIIVSFFWFLKVVVFCVVFIRLFEVRFIVLLVVWVERR